MIASKQIMKAKNLPKYSSNFWHVQQTSHKFHVLLSPKHLTDKTGKTYDYDFNPRIIQKSFETKVDQLTAYSCDYPKNQPITQQHLTFGLKMDTEHSVALYWQTASTVLRCTNYGRQQTILLAHLDSFHKKSHLSFIYLFWGRWS